MGVKKFIKKSVAFVAAAAMALTMVVVPVGAGEAYAAEGTGSTTSDSNPNLVLDKTAKLQSDGTYTITLEAYAKGEVVTTPEVIKPCDIVLVLDQSGSMQWDFDGNNSEYSKSRQKALQDAAKSFIENVATNAANKKVDHKIAIVSFGSDATEKPEFVSLYSQSDSSQNVTGKNALKGTIDKLGQEPEGATRTDLGMQKANELITSTDNSRNRVVVVFTDGYPTTSSKFDIDVANSAISQGKQLKDKNAKIYTVGIFEGADVSQVSGTNSDEVGSEWKIGGTLSGENSDGMNAACNRFLNYLSSNFNNSTSIGLEKKFKDIFIGMGEYYYEITEKFERSSDKYYMTASDRTELNNIFEKISDEVTTGRTDVPLDEKAIVKDVISNNFNLPSDINSNVKVYTEEYNGKDASNNPTWKNRQPLTNADVSYNTGEKSISVSGFSYKDNYIVDGQGSVPTSGKKLIIVIKDVTAKNAGMNMYTNNSNSAIYDGQGGKVKEFPMPQESIDSTSYVLDYGKTVTTAASDYGVSAVTIANADEPSPYNPKAAGTEGRTNVNLKGTYGKFAINGNDLDYTPGKINWDGIDTGYVFGQKSSSTEYKWEEVNFMPATSVYYEDDFASTINKDSDSDVSIVWGGTWTPDKTSDPTDQPQSSENGRYGWDNSYKDNLGYSNGSATKTDEQGATATFTFTGTGVDVYSRTNGDVGLICAELYSGKGAFKTDGKTYKPTLKTQYIDNVSSSGDYYQIPTLSFENLPYGEYTVVITAGYNGTGTSGTYYLDGIRVYNPLKGNATAEKAYDVAGESNAQYIKLRDTLLAKGFGSIKDGDKTVAGSVFIDKIDKTNVIDGTKDDYEKYGPKNEVYLAPGQAIAFEIDGYANAATKPNVFIGLKALNTATEATFTCGDGVDEETINSSSDLYYPVTPTSSGKVIIKNTATPTENVDGNTKGLLAITKLRVTNASSVVGVSASKSLLPYAQKFDSLKVVENNDTENPSDSDNKDETLDKGDVDIDNPSDNDNNKDDNNQGTSNSIWDKILNNIKHWFRK